MRFALPILLLLLAAVLIPTACVLWFMNEAMNSQREVARRRLTEAYRAQLPLMAARLDAGVERRSADLDAAAGAEPDPPAAFERAVREGLADAALVFGPDGSLAYPSVLVTPAADPLDGRADWAAARALEERSAGQAVIAYRRIAAEESNPALAARAVQALVRCLVRTGDKAGALRVISRQFSEGPLRNARDLHGRSIAADAQLLALQLDSGNREAAERLYAMLTTYRGSVLPSSQRLFLMDEIRVLPVPPRFRRFPLREAELLAARYLEAERPGRATAHCGAPTWRGSGG